MGEILLALTIITLSLIIFYIKRQKPVKNDLSQTNPIDTTILKTPKNNRKSQISNISDLNNFNGINNLQNNQFSELNSPFIASNPSYIKIKNINYNNINHVSPINNYSYTTNEHYEKKTPIKDGINKLNFLEENLTKKKYERIYENIKNINLNEHSENLNCEKPEDKTYFSENKLNNTEKKLKINNVFFKEIDFECFKKEKMLNSEKKNIIINCLTKNISYYGINNNYKKENDLEDSFFYDINCQSNFYKMNSKDKYDESTDINIKGEKCVDSKVIKKLSFDSYSKINNNWNETLFTDESKELKNNEKNLNLENSRSSNILEKLISKKRFNLELINKEMDQLEDSIPSPEIIKSGSKNNDLIDSTVLFKEKVVRNNQRLNSKELRDSDTITINNVKYSLNKIKQDNLIDKKNIRKDCFNSVNLEEIHNQQLHSKNYLNLHYDFQNKENQKNITNVEKNHSNHQIINYLITKK
jgi:hypothetical protein